MKIVNEKQHLIPGGIAEITATVVLLKDAEVAITNYHIPSQPADLVCAVDKMTVD